MVNLKCDGISQNETWDSAGLGWPGQHLRLRFVEFKIKNSIENDIFSSK